MQLVYAIDLPSELGKIDAYIYRSQALRRLHGAVSHARCLLVRQRGLDDQAGRVELEGLPPDLVEVLRDQSIVVPHDQAVFELIASWANAPSNTASADEEARE